MCPPFKKCPQPPRYALRPTGTLHPYCESEHLIFCLMESLTNSLAFSITLFSIRGPCLALSPSRASSLTEPSLIHLTTHGTCVLVVHSVSRTVIHSERERVCWCVALTGGRCEGNIIWQIVKDSRNTINNDNNGAIALNGQWTWHYVLYTGVIWDRKHLSEAFPTC